MISKTIGFRGTLFSDKPICGRYVVSAFAAFAHCTKKAQTDPKENGLDS